MVVKNELGDTRLKRPPRRNEAGKYGFAVFRVDIRFRSVKKRWEHSGPLRQSYKMVGTGFSRVKSFFIEPLTAPKVSAKYRDHEC